MFEDSLIESAGRGRGKKSLGFTLVSFFLQACLLGVLILIPLIYTEALPKQQLMGFLVAPPPQQRRLLRSRRSSVKSIRVPSVPRPRFLRRSR